MTTSIEQAKTFNPPSRDSVAKSLRLMNKYFAPEFIGLENVDPKKPTLFVGNHTRYGLLDVPMISQGIYVHTGWYPRGLADRMHYKIPFWRDMIGRAGGVLGSREMCRALMQAGETIMVFPGGGGEVVKSRHDNYKLLWKERLGFVRMAVESGYSITPFSSVGADEALDPFLDGQQMGNSLFGRMLSIMSLDKYLPDGSLPPIPRGLGLTPLPRPEKFYFSFCRPIETKKYRKQADDEILLKNLRLQTADSINTLIKDSLLLRAQEQGKQTTVRRVMQRL